MGVPELWDLVNKDKKRVGKTYVRYSENPIPEGLYHITARVWIKKPDGKLIILQRHPTRADGLLWESTSGAIIHNEKSINGAVREVFEETGIVIDPKELIYLGDVVSNDCIEENYMCKLKRDQCIILQKDEIINAKFFDVDEFDKIKSLTTTAATISFNKFKPFLIQL